MNGKLACSLGDDGVHSYGDTCRSKCNTGYELSGSHTWTCESDGTWSGNNGVCKRGMYVDCIA